jgi:hypothetical protein
MPSENIDLKQILNAYYAPPKHPVIVQVPPYDYLMADGAGNPNHNPQFEAATSALYSLSYTIRFAYKAATGNAYTVMPLEGLWWSQEMDTFIGREKDAWQWTLMILQPEFITSTMVEQARTEALRKKKLTPAQNTALRYERYHAGTCVTMMHIGSYDDETENIAWMHRFAAEQGYQLHGLHQEIYLSDPRKTEPAKMKTVLRQPVRPL